MVSWPRKPGSTSARLAITPSRARLDRMWSMPASLFESSTRSMVAASVCCRGLSVTPRSMRRSTPAGLTRPSGWVANCLVRMAVLISLSERIILAGPAGVSGAFVEKDAFKALPGLPVLRRRILEVDSPLFGAGFCAGLKRAILFDSRLEWAWNIFGTGGDWHKDGGETLRGMLGA